MEDDPQPIVDWNLFSRMRSELGPEFVRILSYFREDGEKCVTRVEQAMKHRDIAAMVVPADTLKTEARELGAEPLGELAEEIEYAARRAIENRLFPDDLIVEVSKLRPLYLETLDLVEKETNPLVARRPAYGRG